MFFVFFSFDIINGPSGLSATANGLYAFFQVYGRLDIRQVINSMSSSESEKRFMTGTSNKAENHRCLTIFTDKDISRRKQLS